MNTYGYIYMTTNLINGKKYIGQHASSVLDEKYKGSGVVLRKAFNKYGIANFILQVLEWCSSKEELDKREIYWIAYYNAVESTDFYNLQVGGTGNKLGSKRSIESRIRMNNNPNYGMRGKHHTEETKKKLSEVHKGLMSGEKNPMYGKGVMTGKHHTEESKKKLSETRKKIGIAKGENNPFYGKHHTEDTKKKISDAHKGKSYLKGIPKSEEHKKHMSESREGLFSGEKNPMYGKHHTEETKKKLSEAKKGKTQSVTHINKRSKTFKGRIWINNGIENKWVQPTELENYLSNGYVKGRLKYVC